MEAGFHIPTLDDITEVRTSHATVPTPYYYHPSLCSDRLQALFFLFNKWRAAVLQLTFIVLV